MTITVFVGTSVDGFIARANHDLDWLPAGGGEPHGYDEFMAGVDALVIGRKNFEKVLTFGDWPYGDKRVVALSRRPIDFSVVRGGMVEQMAGTPAEIVAQLAATGAHHLYIDGGITIQRFLRAGLIDRLIITRVPVLIGDGIPLFGSLPNDVRLQHVSTRTFPSGLVQSEYRVLSGASQEVLHSPQTSMLAEPPAGKLIAVHPVLMCRDVSTSLQFYERLGFATVFRDNDAAPKYAAIRRDGVELHLQWQDAAQFSHSLDRPAYRFHVRDVDALFAEWAEAAKEYGQGGTASPWAAPGDTPWGTREFHLRDADGNGLQFYRPLGKNE